MKAVSAAGMRELDRRTIEEHGTPGAVLMERAGAGVAAEALSFASKLPERHARRFVVLAGKGNNGGDACVTARILNEAIPRREIALHSPFYPEELSRDAAAAFKLLPPSLKNSLKLSLSAADLREGDVIIDGLLGTGARGSLREPFNMWVSLVNSSGLPVVSIDIPSGLDADDGSVGASAMTADMTVTMALPKIGMLLGEGPRRCGRLKIVDIGIPVEYVGQAEGAAEAVFADDVRQFFGREPFDAHKNVRGNVLVIGGSSLYPGAPQLASEAALRCGAGLVHMAIPNGVQLHGSLPDAIIVRRVPDGGSGFFNESSVDILRSLVEKADALVVGPGMSQEPSCAAIVRLAAGSGVPAVFDADALNLASSNPELVSGLGGKAVVTPHPGEMRRLLAGFGLHSLLEAGRFEQAKALSERLGSCVVLKGCRTAIAGAGGRIAVNSSGCPALATAGSGDVLSGLCAALLARGLDPFDSARASVFLHGLAGELAAPCGSRGVIADDLNRFIPEALKELSPLA